MHTHMHVQGPGHASTWTVERKRRTSARISCHTTPIVSLVEAAAMSCPVVHTLYMHGVCEVVYDFCMVCA